MIESFLQSQVLYSAVMFIVVLSILVFVHELGHYLAAKSVKVKVKAFSIGFGKEIFGFTRKNGERWKFCLLPLGGYVSIYGMDPEEDDIKDEKDEEKLKDAFYKKNVLARIWIVFAGPLANFLFAVVALTMLFSAYGIKQASTVIGDVMPNMPAQEAGLLAGDKVLAINNEKVTTWTDLVEFISKSSANEELDFNFQRGEEVLNLVMKPEHTETENILEEKIQKRMIGVRISTDYSISEDVSFTQAVENSFAHTYNMTVLILKSVKRMITGEMKADVGGPLTIAEQSGKAAQGGIYALVMFMVMISINLGILNLLPIPALDGGHIMYSLIEILTFGKGLHDKIKMVANAIGIGLLVMLMGFAFYKDITRIFF
jgi:regulator of sigma E protease